ncbi:MAG: GTP pyrophosphokinase family protein [Clostridia bacterium]|nr:GTP pyrophosphokinase family protein [Clostridia bacterium]
MTAEKDFDGNVIFDAGEGPTNEFIREYKRLKPLYSGALKTACAKFEILDDEFSMLQGHDPIHYISSRLKTVESAYEKLKRRGFAQTPENLVKLTDIAGVRVICSYIEDIYKIARVFLNQNGVRLLNEKDYIKTPKSNGYRSLHLIVEVPVALSSLQMGIPVEIQLRTISMNMWASLEHEVSYKVDKGVADSYREELKACADDLFAVEERMQKICHGIRACAPPKTLK